MLLQRREKFSDFAYYKKSGIRFTNTSCPNCKSRDFSIAESFVNFLNFHVIDGVFNNDCYEEEGDVVSVECECDRCHTKWTPRDNKTGKKSFIKDQFLENFDVNEIV